MNAADITQALQSLDDLTLEQTLASLTLMHQKRLEASVITRICNLADSGGITLVSPVTQEPVQAIALLALHDALSGVGVAEVLVGDSWFKMKELPQILKNHMGSLERANRQLKRNHLQREAILDYATKVKADPSNSDPHNIAEFLIDTLNGEGHRGK